MKQLGKLNPDKCSYLIFSRAKVDFVTRLSVNGKKLTRKLQLKFWGARLIKMLAAGRPTPKRLSNRTKPKTPSFSAGYALLVYM